VAKSFKSVLRAWRDVCIQSMRTTIVSQTSGYIAPILPMILCAPKFLDNAMTLGEVMQAASAFTIVQSALNWLVDGWQLLSRSGSRGPVGETGPRGKKGDRGDRGEARPTIVNWVLDRKRYRAIPTMSDGKLGAPLELRGLFEQFCEERDGAA
jgi:hypothetical protein